jgi:hypothetical protein
MISTDLMADSIFTEKHQAAAGAPWLFLCAGMRRGGSTLQAQLVSALLGDARIVATSPESLRNVIAEADGLRIPVVYKCHQYIPQLASFHAEGGFRVFYVYRDIRDVVASISEKYSIPAFSFVHGGVLPILREYEQWTRLPGVYVSCYERMLSDLAAEVCRLGAHIGISVDDASAARIASEFSIEKQQSRIREAFSHSGAVGGRGLNAHDDRSLLHKDHIQFGGSGAFRRVLGWHETAALEWVTRDWMRATGYRPDYSKATQVIAYGWFRFRGALHNARTRLAVSLRGL